MVVITQRKCGQCYWGIMNLKIALKFKCKQPYVDSHATLDSAVPVLSCAPSKQEATLLPWHPSLLTYIPRNLIWQLKVYPSFYPSWGGGEVLKIILISFKMQVTVAERGVQMKPVSFPTFLLTVLPLCEPDFLHTPCLQHLGSLAHLFPSLWPHHSRSTSTPTAFWKLFSSLP